MFNNNVEEGADFCEAYKSQILNEDSPEKESVLSVILKILTILFLLAMIIGLSLYGYNYFIANQKDFGKNSIISESFSPPVSIQSLDDDDLKIELAPSLIKTEKKEKLEKIKEPVPPKKDEKREEVLLDDLDIDKIANEVKLAIAKNEQEEDNQLVPPISKQLEESPNDTTQSAYLEELAKLSREIDKERE